MDSAHAQHIQLSGSFAELVVRHWVKNFDDYSQKKAIILSIWNCAIKGA
jgi:hypothetical protein